jgi:hypothetical protein
MVTNNNSNSSKSEVEHRLDDLPPVVPALRRGGGVDGKLSLNLENVTSPGAPTTISIPDAEKRNVFQSQKR